MEYLLRNLVQKAQFSTLQFNVVFPFRSFLAKQIVLEKEDFFTMVANKKVMIMLISIIEIHFLYLYKFGIKKFWLKILRIFSFEILLRDFYNFINHSWSEESSGDEHILNYM